MKSEFLKLLSNKTIAITRYKHNNGSCKLELIVRSAKGNELKYLIIPTIISRFTLSSPLMNNATGSLISPKVSHATPKIVIIGTSGAINTLAISP